MGDPKSEVRLCPKCAQTAVVLVNDWKHTTSGISTSESTYDYRCQSCGAWYIKRPRSRLIAFWILGVLFVIPCGFGLIFIYLAWRQQNFDRRVQVVQGAPVPALRYPGGPPKRTCGQCGGVASALKITRHTHNGVPTGTDYEYTCAGCGLTFETENVLAHVFSTFFVSVLGGISALFFFVARHPGWRYGGGLVALGLGGVLLWQLVERVYNRVKHRAVESS